MNKSTLYSDNTYTQNISRGEFDAKWNIKVIKSLNQLLADEFGVFTKTLNYHWNVVGPRFHSMHKFMEKHYKILLNIMDDVAERTRIIGGTPIGTMSELTEKLQLHEKPGQTPSTNQMLIDLQKDHLAIQEELLSILGNKEKYKIDPGTEDFLISVLRKHEEMSWMIKSHLEQ